MVGTTISAPFSGSKRGDQPVDHRGIDLRHVAEADDGAVGLRRHRGDAGLERGAETVGKPGLCTNSTGKPASAASTRSRWWPVTTITGRAREASACSAAMRTSGLAADLGQKLVRPAHAGRAPGGEHDRGDICAPAASAQSRGCGRVTISISRPPTPMPVMSSRGTGRPREKPHQHPVEAIFLGAARAARRAQHRMPGGMPTSMRLPGSTGMPKCSMRPPIASSAAGMTSRRSAIAEAPNTMTSSAPCSSTSSSARASAAARAAPGARRRSSAPAGASRSAVILQCLVDHLSAKAGQQRRDDADFAHPIGRDANHAAACAAASALSRAAAATANGMIFTVAIISPATTGLKAGSVASVMSSSTRLRRSMPPCRRPARRRSAQTDWRGR